jgi:hypothetical protein
MLRLAGGCRPFTGRSGEVACNGSASAHWPVGRTGLLTGREVAADQPVASTLGHLHKFACTA